ncbi:MAG: hypothetical protein methR_P0615 [Methyloprofundus sp.]|nr:MAG: hypothetical protein methR_P0615 [Methyloprofundus sp.]
MKNITSADVFVSYASHDKIRVSEIVQQLELSGIRCWRDQEQIIGGGNYGLEIVNGIRQAKILLLMCSNASLRSKNVKQEIQLAWKYHIPYLPILLDPIPYPEQVEYWLEGCQWIELLNHPTEKWLPAILMAISQTGINSNVSVNYTPPPIKKGWFGKIKQLLSLEQSTQHPTTPPSSTLKAITQQQDLQGLRALAKFTDQIWPVPADKPANNKRGLRDLGAIQDEVQHGFQLGGQVRLAIESDREGYLLLLDEGTSGKIYCLCPSQFAPESTIQAGRCYLPQAGARYKAFAVTGMSGREHLLAIISDQPLMLDWMPTDPKIPARELNRQDIAELLGELHKLGDDQWTVLSTYFDVL